MTRAGATGTGTAGHRPEVPGGDANPDPAWVAQRLATYLDGLRPDGAPHRVTGLRRIPGGASRQTWRATVHAGNGEERGLIVRRDPASSLIDTERSAEYAAYCAVHDFGRVPVPEPVALEEDPAWLGQPFSLMAEIPGCATAIAELPDGAEGQRLGHRFWNLLGELTHLPVTEEPRLTACMPVPAPDACAARELAYWSGVIEQDAQKPEPVARAAKRWLEARLPPPAQRLCLVHGDYRAGNFLFRRDGSVHGILDWEMAHVGDPYEDLAWSLDPVWGWPDRERAGRLLPPREAVAAWQETSGLAFDPEAFRWWSVFASYKAFAIWVSSTEDFGTAPGRDPILAVAGWMLTDRQRRILLDRIAPDGEHRYTEAWP